MDQPFFENKRSAERGCVQESSPLPSLGKTRRAQTAAHRVSSPPMPPLCGSPGGLGRWCSTAGFDRGIGVFSNDLSLAWVALFALALIAFPSCPPPAAQDRMGALFLSSKGLARSAPQWTSPGVQPCAVLRSGQLEGFDRETPGRCRQALGGRENRIRQDDLRHHACQNPARRQFRHSHMWFGAWGRTARRAPHPRTFLSQDPWPKASALLCATASSCSSVPADHGQNTNRSEDLDKKAGPLQDRAQHGRVIFLNERPASPRSVQERENTHKAFIHQQRTGLLPDPSGRPGRPPGWAGYFTCPGGLSILAGQGRRNPRAW